MPNFLCIRLHGPLASWGDVAVGDRRPSSPHLSRSAVLGLVAGALGLRRSDSAALQALDDSLGFAARTDAPGELLTDFHTAQGPAEALLRSDARAAKREGRPWHRPATRRAELAWPRADLQTVLSQRQYRVDALWTAALWLRGRAAQRWTLEDISAALSRPQFVPYLGRKSCPLDIPMQPQVVKAADPVAAMAKALFNTDDILAAVLGRGRRATVHWEESWTGLVPDQSVRRRDRVISRSRWQFTERTEHQKASPEPEAARDVPE